MKIALTSDILKCRVTDRWSFIGDEGFEALKKYLDLRLPLKDDDLIFGAEKGKPRGAKLEPGAVSQAFNKMVQKLRLAERRGTKPKDLRLYCLRKAFRKLMASDVDQSYVEFWMGHTTTATHYLSSDVEHHRAIYAKGYPSLQIHEFSSDTRSRIEEQQKEIENLKKQLAEQQAALGILRDLLTSDEKVIERVRLKMTGVSTGSDSDRQPQA